MVAVTGFPFFARSFFNELSKVKYTMAKKDSESVSEDFLCVKEVTCEWCETVFRFPLKLSIDGSGPNKLVARKNAAENAKIKLPEEPGTERCPSCGALQTCMEASGSALGFGCLTVLMAICLGIAITFGVLVNLHLLTSVSLPVVGWILVALAIPIVLFNIYLARINPNSELNAGLEEAKTKVAEGKITVVSQPKSVIPESIPRSTGIVPLIAIGLSVIGLCLIPAAEVFRMASGWTAHPFAVPPVAGPGDEVTLNWPNSVNCLKGKWRGIVEVEMTDPVGKHPKTKVDASCSTEQWGNWSGGRGNRNRDTAIWTKVKLPDDAALAGKDVSLHAKILVTYPQSSGLLRFENKEAEFVHDFQMKLSSPKSSTMYFEAWWIGIVGGGGLIALASWFCRLYQLNVVKNSPHPKTLYIKNFAEPDDLVELQ